MKNLIFIPVLLVALAAFGPESDNATGSTVGSLTSGNIRVLDTSYIIDFPETIVFYLHAEADVPITAVTFYYRVGNQRVTVYGYPTFVSGNRISAYFTLDTGVLGFLPVGADIEYAYLLQDETGRQYQTEPLQMEYLDPRFDWRHVELDNIIVAYHDRPEGQILSVARQVSDRLHDVYPLFDLDDVNPMKAVLVNSPSEASRSFPSVSKTADSIHLYTGFAFGEYDLFVMIGDSEDTIVHEMTHLILDEAMVSPLARVPSWLNEGLAMYFEDDNRDRDRELAAAVREDRLMRIRHMAGQPGRPRDVILFYAQANSFVQYLIDVRGWEQMKSFLREIGLGRTLDVALSNTYGMTLENLERQWRIHMGSPLTETPSTSTGKSLPDETDIPTLENLVEITVPSNKGFLISITAAVLLTSTFIGITVNYVLRRRSFLQ